MRTAKPARTPLTNTRIDGDSQVLHIIHMKRTNLVLNEQTLEEALRLSGERTYSATVNRALDEFVRGTRAGRIPGLGGPGLGGIRTQEDSTTDRVNDRETGAGKLVNDSLEDEAAKLRALQTRQALGIQSLAIANTSQQSILALFR